MVTAVSGSNPIQALCVVCGCLLLFFERELDTNLLFACRANTQNDDLVERHKCGDGGYEMTGMGGGGGGGGGGYGVSAIDLEKTLEKSLKAQRETVVWLLAGRLGISNL